MRLISHFEVNLPCSVMFARTADGDVSLQSRERTVDIRWRHAAISRMHCMGARRGRGSPATAS